MFIGARIRSLSKPDPSPKTEKTSLSWAVYFLSLLGARVTISSHCSMPLSTAARLLVAHFFAGRALFFVGEATTAGAYRSGARLARVEVRIRLEGSFVPFASVLVSSWSSALSIKLRLKKSVGVEVNKNHGKTVVNSCVRFERQLFVPVTPLHVRWWHRQFLARTRYIGCVDIKHGSGGRRWSSRPQSQRGTTALPRQCRGR